MLVNTYVVQSLSHDLLGHSFLGDVVLVLAAILASPLDLIVGLLSIATMGSAHLLEILAMLCLTTSIGSIPFVIMWINHLYGVNTTLPNPNKVASSLG